MDIFLIEDDGLCEKFNTIRNKVSSDIKREFDSEPVYNQNFLKTKIKSYGDDVTDFYDKEIPKVNSNHTCLAVISLDSALKKMKPVIHKSFYLKSANTLGKKVIRQVIDDLERSDEEWIKGMRIMCF